MKRIVVTFLVLFSIFTLSLCNVFAYSESPDILEFNAFVDTLKEKATSEETILEETVLEETTKDDTIPKDTDTEVLEEFSITGGLAKDTNLTFDSKRTIFGESLKDTKVVLSIYNFDNELDTFVCADTFEIEVGASGIFSQSVPISLGENYFYITATFGDSVATKTAIVKRKDLEIKHELERGFAFPGQKFQYETSIPWAAIPASLY